MGLSLTAFGAVFLPFALAVAYLALPELLLILAFVAAVMQAPAVAVVGIGGQSYGITPFNVACCLSAAFLVRLVLSNATARANLRDITAADVSWFSFFAWTAIGAVIMPLLFSGVPIRSLMDKYGFAVPPVPLKLTLGHIAQTVNVVGIAALFLLVKAVPDREGVTRACYRGTIAAFVLSALIGAQQRLAYLGIGTTADGFWGSNPTYNNEGWHHQFGAFVRAAFPFIEPSYASAWFSAIACGAFTTLLFGRARLTMLVVFILALVALLNTVGGAGLFGAFLFFILLVLIITGQRCLRSTPDHVGVWRKMLTSVAIIVVGATLAASALHVTGVSEPVAQTARALIKKRVELVDGSRFESNKDSIGIVAATYGLGAGAGSHRAASYFASLAANGGLVGLGLFAWAIISTIALGLRSSATAETKAFVLGAVGAMALSVGAGVSDQHWPPFWTLMALLYALSRLPAERTSYF